MNTRFLLGFTFVALIAAVAVRLLPHIPNFTPLGAFALFVGVFVARKHWWGLLLPLFAMFLSDLFIGFYDFKLMAVVYGSFLVYTGLGMLVAKRKSIAMVFLGSMGGAMVFYLVTNFAVWAFSSWYPHTVSGLLLSYTLALPFFKYMILGDLFFTSILFGVYELAAAFLYQPVQAFGSEPQSRRGAKTLSGHSALRASGSMRSERRKLKLNSIKFLK